MTDCPSAIRRHQIRSSDQLGHITPNLAFDSSGAFVGVGSATRSSSAASARPTTCRSPTPSVALYVDGIRVARSVGGALDLLDVERVEVLRGAPRGRFSAATRRLARSRSIRVGPTVALA